MPIRSLILPVLAVIVVGVLALALGHSRSGPTSAASGAIASGTTARLRIANYAFVPAALTVRAGTTITATNTDGTAHTGTAASGAFDTGTLKSGQSTHFTLNKVGTYTYICQFHAFMTGIVKVVK